MLCNLKNCFKVIPASTDALKNEVFRIRYDVYCEELGYEDTKKFPDKLEQDSYDAHSLHYLLWHKSSEQFAGCVRLAKTAPGLNNQKLPFELTCNDTLDRSIIDISQLPANSYAEISRLAVRSAFRRRSGEKDSTSDGVILQANIEDRRSFPSIAFGLYLAAAASGLNANLERVFAMMEPRLARLLRISGIHFEQIGKAIEHRSLRAPYQITEVGFYEHMPENIKLLLDDIREDIEAAG